MDTYNDGSTFDRDDAALVPEPQPSGVSASNASADDVGETTPGIGDTTVGAVDAADAEFAASAEEPGSETDATAGDPDPAEPVDRFDDDGSASSGPELNAVPSTLQPGTQDDDPIYAELGEDGQGDLAPEDL